MRPLDSDGVPAGRYAVRLACGEADMARAQALRGTVFGRGDADSDAFDPEFAHVLVEERASGALVCCYRMKVTLPERLRHGYAARYYDLSALESYGRPMLEMGRFCLHPDWHDPDILRLAWAVMTVVVDARGIGLLFGCSSFAGTDPAAYAGAFALLATRARAPMRWRPGECAAEVFRFGTLQGAPVPELAQVPPLLRTYLAMGGWVSDHAVIDREMGTLHVLTGVEVATIPQSRQRLLRAAAARLPDRAALVPEKDG
ncbi:GNAT family N-acetyltransferase [Sagittula salina]|uniref:L-ornithine N(alpha)-acyltransferase n=1 Tax=Sagittula salina TaxID=2820268 RepID=A0A940MQN9_9RHOB|nr:GNAT family N-acetyltransferase [Sagittula salina]MBP0482963.1 GNAT family N-acetyltransferase [Sagittula salina]